MQAVARQRTGVKELIDFTAVVWYHFQRNDRREVLKLIHGIGTDIVKISRIEKSLRRTEGFAEKIFVSGEIEYCSSKAYPAQHFAANFAVKEAFIKAFGISSAPGMRFHDFILRHHEDGRPFIELGGATKKLFDEKKLKTAHVSISHDTDYAVAFVVIEC